MRAKVFLLVALTCQLLIAFRPLSGEETTNNNNNNQTKSRQLFPHQLHCSASLRLSSPKQFTLDLLQVDEYIDLDSRRSSLLVYNRALETEQIYYNSIGRDEILAERKFIQYDVDKNTCQSQRVGYWPLALLRKTALMLYSIDVDLATKRFVDISLGPSVLLYTIEYYLDQFIWQRTAMSRSRLTEVDIYQTTLGVDSIESYDKVDLRVSVIKRHRGNRLRPEMCSGETSLAKTLAFYEYFEITTILACKITSSSSSSSMGPALDSDEEIDCEYGDILFQIDYNIISELATKSSSMIGRRLSEQSRYQFKLEPFVQPIGIGCWETDRRYEWQKNFQIPSMQFSAEYMTTNGSKGVSYVALDNYRNILRLDRNGRKSVYDLADKTSYHIGQFSSSHERLEQGPAGSSAQNSPNQDNSFDKCFVLKYSDDLNLDSYNAVERLLGLSLDNHRTYHLGTRVIDHVPYEIFEFELSYYQKIGYNLPVLMEPEGFVMDKAYQSRRSYIMTYYVQELPEGVRLNKREQNSRQTNEATVMIPKYIEMWQFDRDTNRRLLLNRLSFVEFSWTLDVEPSNDPDTQVDLSNLFTIEQCHRVRATQAELTLDIVGQTKTTAPMTANQVEGLRANRLHIQEDISQKLASTLGISRLNLAKLNLDIRTSAQVGGQLTPALVVKSQIVELKLGITCQLFMGLTRWEDSILDQYILSMSFNRHSIDECKLDSVSWPQANWFAYCPKLATCLILSRSDDLANQLKQHRGPNQANVAGRSEEASNSDDSPANNLCGIYLYNWIERPDLGTSMALKTVSENLFKLSGLQISFYYNYNQEANGAPSSKNNLITGDYSAYVQTYQFRELDSLGAKMSASNGNLMAYNLLNGLSYTTMSEESEQRNMNKQLELDANWNSFRHCQLACQMDDQCGSFSICLRKTGRSKKSVANASGQRLVDKCVLSTLRLTGDRLAKFSSLMVKSKREKKFKVPMTSETESQVFVIHLDEDCHLHPKDFLADYAIYRTIERSDDDLRTISEQTSKNKTSMDLSSLGNQSSSGGLVVRKHMSLDDCAGLNYESMLLVNPISSSFAHCPLESMCVIDTSQQQQQNYDGNQAASKLLRQLVKASTGHCMIFNKKHSRFYNEKRMNHLIVSLDKDGPSNTTKSSAASGDESNSKQQTGELSEDFLRQLEASELVTTFWGLNTEQCARDCNLHQSNCLAFDICRQQTKTLCILFSVRSVSDGMSHFSPSLPLLQREQQLNSIGQLKLVGSPICDHYPLKRAYLEVKLKQMLAKERRSSNSTTSGSQTGDNNNDDNSGNNLYQSEIRDRLDSMEDRILNSDRQLSDQIGGADRDDKSIEISNQATGANRRSDGGFLSPLALFIGFLLGCMGALYGRPACEAAKRLYLYEKGRRARGTDGFGSQLVLPNDRDL